MCNLDLPSSMCFVYWDLVRKWLSNTSGGQSFKLGVHSCLTHSQVRILTSKDLKFGDLTSTQMLKERLLDPTQVTTDDQLPSLLTRDGHRQGMGSVYPYPAQLIYPWIPDYLTLLASILNCYPVCLSMDIHTLPKPNFYKITKYAQKPLKRPKYHQNL